MNKINNFRGEYRWLSNFADGGVSIQGYDFDNREAAFQAMKTVDEEEIKKFFHATPSEAKRLGRQVQLVSNWESIKVKVMRAVCRAYFEQHQDMKEKLIATKGIYLEEGNQWHDNFWGVCYCEKCENKEKHNTLGKILMEIRDSYLS